MWTVLRTQNRTSYYYVRSICFSKTYYIQTVNEANTGHDHIDCMDLWISIKANITQVKNRRLKLSFTYLTYIYPYFYYIRWEEAITPCFNRTLIFSSALFDQLFLTIHCQLYFSTQSLYIIAHNFQDFYSSLPIRMCINQINEEKHLHFLAFCLNLCVRQ